MAVLIVVSSVAFVGVLKNPTTLRYKATRSESYGKLRKSYTLHSEINWLARDPQGGSKLYSFWGRNRRVPVLR